MENNRFLLIRPIHHSFVETLNQSGQKGWVLRGQCISVAKPAFFENVMHERGHEVQRSSADLKYTIFYSATHFYREIYYMLLCKYR